MKSRIAYIAPARAAPGMELAKAVFDRDGHVLLAAETVLDAEVLERLIRRGVEFIAVLVLDMRDDDTIANDLRLAEARVDAIFRGPGSPAREALRAAVFNFRQESAK